MVLSLHQAQDLQPSTGLTELVKITGTGSDKKLIILGGRGDGGVCCEEGLSDG